MPDKFEYTPLQTEYRGHRFRSRIEARWAVFFDMLKIPFEYEPEGVRLLIGGAYLPDFILRPDPDRGPVWFEVKGDAPDAEEIAKARELAALTRRSCLIAFGNFSSGYASFATPVMIKLTPDGSMTGLYTWYHCSTCSKVGIKLVTEEFFEGCSCHYPYQSAILDGAYRAARAARFGT
jgi:hypothetical protein